MPHRVTPSKEKAFQVHISIVPMRFEGISNKSVKEKDLLHDQNLNKNLNTLKIEFTGTL